MSFFKRKVLVETYLRTRLNYLLSTEQSERWLTFKRTCLDKEMISVDEDLYLTHMRAASVELLSMAIVKKFRNVKLFMQMSNFIDTYLDQNDATYVRMLLDLYSRALASPIDGVGSMTVLMMDSLCQSRCSEKTKLYFRDFFYVGLQSFREEFKQFKLVPR